jgi:methylmalonyl-CoA mutase cobalamin-binding subunit
MPPAEHPQLSIGALSRATGIPVETLRTWEHRYGFPAPERRPSGHRVYSRAIVPRLRRISEAIARGHRAGQVVSASDTALAVLLASPDVHAASLPADVPGAAGVDDLLDAVRHYDAARLTQRLLADWARLGVLGFLTERVGPLLDAVGEGWAASTLEIRHEHFISEHLGALLRSLRAPFDERAQGPVCVLATLPGEQHGLGLLMAGLVAAAADMRVRIAGTDLPVAQVAAFARDVHARVVAISVSSSGASTAARHLRALRKRMPRQVLVVTGGAGAPTVDGTERMTSLPALDARLRTIVRP